MNFFTLFSALLLACSSVVALPFREHILEERQGPITYLTAKSNVATRYEIRQLQATQPNQYALFILALNRWMKKPKTDPTSFFAIASIHGVPRDTYNNVGQCRGPGCADADGYAVHDSMLFATWHRGFIALYEQELVKVAKEIASEYPSSQRQAMQHAANALRLPYYDSAAHPPGNGNAFPGMFTSFRVTVNGPNGTKTLLNPLFRYQISDPSNFYYPIYNRWPNTLRHPFSNAPDTSSNTPAVVSAMNSVRQSLADGLYSLFTNCHDWMHVSNDHAASSIPSCAGSIEQIHNSVHLAIGGNPNRQTGLSGGHMTALATSAFDPVFWLHHANVDRLFAMWQTLNPNSWAGQQSQFTASWTIPAGQIVSQESVLTPFFKESGGGPGGFWTSNMVRNWRVLGYTYPEYSHSSGSPQDIARYINNLYGPNANAPAGSSKRDSIHDILQSTGSEVVNNTVNSAISAATSTATTASSAVPTSVGSTSSTLLSSLPNALPISNPLVANNGSIFQYIANIYTPRYALNGTYEIYLFNGEPINSNFSTWLTQPNLIGFMAVLSKPGMTDNPFITSGSISLTRTLQDLTKSSPAILPDLTEALVVPYLAQHLVWKVVGENGEIDPATIPGFVIAVYASTAPQVADDELPQWSPFVELLDVTREKAGGANMTGTGLA